MPKGDYSKTKESIVPLQGVVRDGKLAALLDHEGKEIGMPVTALASVTGGIKTIAVLTQAQYDALAVKDPNTEYNIVAA
ncbi:MAG: hypothetical protein WAV95_15845 [Azonexus sp.]